MIGDRPKGSEWWANAPEDLASDAYHDYVLDAVESGWLWWQWRVLQVGPLTVQVMTAPLAVGTEEDHVYLCGMSAALMDKIQLCWGWSDDIVERQPGEPDEIMTPTSLILDAFAADPRAVLVGPFTQGKADAAWYMSAHGTLDGERVDLRELLADPERAHLVTVHGAQSWSIHPEALK